MRLHFDGFAEHFDFWANADSMNIFPVGYAEKNGHKLHPPKGYVANNFNWNAYLKICKATAAPKTLFANKNVILLLLIWNMFIRTMEYFKNCKNRGLKKNYAKKRGEGCYEIAAKTA